MASVGLAVSAPNTEEKAVFTQLKPVRMCGADGPEDSSVFEDVKPAVRLATTAVEMAQVWQAHFNWKTQIFQCINNEIFL